MYRAILGFAAAGLMLSTSPVHAQRGGSRGGGGHGGGHAAPSHGSVHSGSFHSGSVHHGSVHSGNFHSGNFNHHNHNGRFFFGFYPGFGYYGYPGYGYYGNSGYGYYGNSDYYSASPYYYENYVGPSYSYYTPPPPVAVDDTPMEDSSAHVQVIVPVADAQVWFDGTATKSKGTTRFFDTPPLDLSGSYRYAVRARWNEGGKEAGDERVVRVRAGKRYVVDFTQPAPQQ
jgi:uncharacterized protein (TIGR03000 family)